MSAGADPGPVCYELGGTLPTITDANLVLGRVENLVGGRMRLNREKALEAIMEKIAGPLNLDPIAAARGILDIAINKMVRLMDKYGPDLVLETCQEAICASENYLRGRIKELPKITAIYEDFLDNDGFGDTPLRIKVKVTIGEDHIAIDFTGTSSQCQGPYNCGYPLAWTAALLAIKIAFDPKGPTNEGIMRPIQVQVPEGSILNARYPAATGGATDVVVRAVEAILGALSTVMPEAVPGCDFGAINHTYISTVDRSSGRRHIYYSYPPGGNGGTCRMDGPGGLRGPQMGDVSLQSMEMAEGLFPLLFRRFEFNPNSGGAGKFRGGLGLAIDVELLTDGMLSVVSERGRIPAYGLLGGDPGLAQDWLVSRKGTPVSLGVKIGSYPLMKGDIVQIRPGGGGGYGDPLERDPQRVKQDIVNRLISVEHAEEAYGVVIHGEDLSVDLSRTGEKRRQLKKQRKLFKVESSGETINGEVLRLVYFSASEKPFAVSETLELISFSRAAPLRATADLSGQVKRGSARLDTETMAILDISAGDSVWIRSLRRVKD